MNHKTKPPTKSDLLNNMARKLNLGCGEFKKDGYVNVDFSPYAKPDVCHNLNTFPYPFPENSFDLIEADHVLEHLEDPFTVMKELYRIAADGAYIHIRVPHFSRGMTHAQHARGFDVTFPYYFNPQFKGGYQDVCLVSERVRLSWFAWPHLKRTVMPWWMYWIGYAVGVLINVFANMSPLVCSRIWCYWVGGFEEIEFVFRVQKTHVKANLIRSEKNADT